MPAVPFRPRLGERMLVALSCAVCGRLRAGNQYDRRPRVAGGPRYVDRRCRDCRWSRMAANPGR
jgi:hypothetical protein